MYTVRWWGLLVAAALAGGCASSDEAGDDPPQPGTDDAGAGGSVDAAPPVADAAGDAADQEDAGDEADAAPEVDLGPSPEVDLGVETPDAGADHGPRPGALRASVVLTRTPQARTATATAALTEPVPLEAEPGCRVVEVDPGAEVPAPRGYHGGDLVVTGVAGGELRFRPSGDAEAGFTYAADRAVDEQLFGDGGALRLFGEGGPHLGPFAVDLAAPAAVRLQAPPDFGLSHDKGNPLEVRFTPAASDSLLLMVIPTRPFSADPDRGSWVFCALDESGRFEVPSEALRPVASGGGPLGRSALVVLTRTRIAQVALGDDDVVFTASTSHGAAITLR